MKEEKIQVFVITGKKRLGMTYKGLIHAEMLVRILKDNTENTQKRRVS